MGTQIIESLILAAPSWRDSFPVRPRVSGSHHFHVPTRTSQGEGGKKRVDQGICLRRMEGTGRYQTVALVSEKEITCRPSTQPQKTATRDQYHQKAKDQGTRRKEDAKNIEKIVRRTKTGLGGRQVAFLFSLGYVQRNYGAREKGKKKPRVNRCPLQ